MDERLKPDWFRSYLLNPQAYRPGTLIPPLWPGGVATVKDVLDGDTEKQIGSIWAFAAKGEGAPEGFPEHAPNAFELIPTERAGLQRTFMKGVGSQTIVVGFPGGVNLAYDAASGQPAKMWRGRCFDAYSTWYVRAAPFEDPLGEDVLDWPETGEKAARVAEFRGYKLDGKGNPTFLLRVNGQSVEDHFEGSDGKLTRTVRGAWPELRHPVGADVAAKSGDGIQTFVYSWK